MKKIIQPIHIDFSKRKTFFPLLLALLFSLVTTNANATTKTVGASGCDYTTISSAIGAYSSVTDSLVLVLQSNYSAETNLTISQAATALKPIVIRPAAALSLSGLNWTITGKYIYIDGRTLLNGNNNALSFSSSTISFSTNNTNKIGYCNLNNFTVGIGVKLLGAITINGTLTLSSTLTTNNYIVTIADGATITRTASAATISTAPTYAGTFNLIYSAIMTMGNEVSSVYNTDNKINNITVTAGTVTVGGALYIRGNLDLQSSTSILSVGVDTYHINLYGDMPATGLGYINIVAGKKPSLNLYGAAGTTQNLRVNYIYNMTVNTSCTVKLGYDITPTLATTLALNQGILDFNGHKIDFSASLNTFTLTRGGGSSCLNSGVGGGFIPNGKYYVQYQTSSPVSTGIEMPDLGTYTNGIYQLNLLSGGSDITLASNVKVANAMTLNNNLILGNGVTLTLVPQTFTVANSSKIYAANGIIEYASASGQSITNIANSTFGGLKINNAADVTLGSAITINGNLTLNTGRLKTAGYAVTLTGNTIGSGSIYNATSSITFAGTSEQTFASTITNATPPTTININAGSKLTNTGTISTTNLNILSDETNGTGTLVNNGTFTVAGTSNISQYLTSGRNWYLSSPMTSASISSLSSATSVQYWDETNGTWIEKSSGSLAVGTGYISAGTTTTGNITFSGALNDGDIPVSLTRTTGKTKEGFNLIGNPYPSYLNWKAAYEDSENTLNANVGPTIWYRTKNAASTSYIFATYGAVSNVGASVDPGDVVTGNIPPMQAFWVRVNEGQSAGTLKFKNVMRVHKGTQMQGDGQTYSDSKLRTRSNFNSIQQVMRLEVSNGVNTDEAIVLFNNNAQNGIDVFDSYKMTNSNVAIPEIYTKADGYSLAINGLNSMETVPELPLGFTTGQSNTFTIRASQISNFEGYNLFLRDNQLSTEVDLTSGEAYNFTSDATTTDNRFKLIFKSSSLTSELKNAELTNVHVFSDPYRQIVITNSEKFGANDEVTVFNCTGQKLIAEHLNLSKTILRQYFNPGIYVVALQVNGKLDSRKVVIR